jgi:hypothetical protein
MFFVHEVVLMIVMYNYSVFIQELHCIFCHIIVDGLTYVTQGHGKLRDYLVSLPSHLYTQGYIMHDGFCQADIVMFGGHIRLDHKNCFHDAKTFFTLLKCNLDFTL